MTKYAIQHKDDHRWWQGGERWTSEQSAARAFEFMADAYMTAFTECLEAPTDYVVVAVSASSISLHPGAITPRPDGHWGAGRE